MDITKLKLDIDEWSKVELASYEQHEEFLPTFNRQQGFNGRTRLTIREEISVANVFLCLLGQFGAPNGVLTGLRNNHDAVKSEILWHYMLTWRGSLIQLVAHAYRIEVVFAADQPVALTAEGFADLLKEWMSRNGKKIADARNQVTHWHSFLNPLRQMSDACERMLYRAQSLDAGLAKSREHPITSAEIAWHEANLQAHALAAAELASCCLAVRMMAPVLGEMFVNLIIHNRYRGEIPKVRERDHFTAASILVRLERLHRECSGFSRPVDMQSPPLQTFLTLMNSRNDLLHGNILPDRRKEDELLMYHGVPMPKEYRSIYDRSIGPILNAFPLAEAERDYQAARGLVTYLLDCLEPEVADSFQPMLESLDLHQERNERKLTALYTNINAGPQALAGLYKHIKEG
jgi:hypothetical protein